MAEQTLLLSIRPRFAECIFAGTKTVELRRVRPRVNAGDRVLIYVSSPVMALVGGFEVESVLEHSPDWLWRKVGKESGLQRCEFLDYFDGAERAYAIQIARTWKCAVPSSLQELRKRVPGFSPPQSYWYLSVDLIAALCISCGNGVENHKRNVASAKASMTQCQRRIGCKLHTVQD